MSLYLLEQKDAILYWMSMGISEEEAEEKAAELFSDKNRVLLKDCRYHYQDGQIFTTEEFKEQLEEEYGIEFIEIELG
jgi:transposase